MHFGIDLGTSTSLIAVFRDGRPEVIPNALGSYLTPSVVAVRDDALIVAETARRIALTDRSSAADRFKRHLGTDQSFRLGYVPFTAVDLTAMILSAFKADAEAYLGVPVTHVVIAVPASFEEPERNAVRAAGRMAGLIVDRLVNEPTAAVLVYGLHEMEGVDRAFVHDLGGGTFDVSIVEFRGGVIEVRASACDTFLGGGNFTSALMSHIAIRADIDELDPEANAQLRRLAKPLKRQLTNQTEVRVTAQVADREVDLTITRDQFEEMTAPIMDRMNTVIDRALGDSGLAPEDIDKLVLVGGATRIQSVRSHAVRRFRRLPVVGLDPDHVVALGAAVQAALVAGNAAIEDIVRTDVAAFTLGIGISHPTPEGRLDGYFAPIIERDSVVPVSRERHFTTVEPGQDHVRIEILQGESPVASNNLHLGTLRVPVPVNRDGLEGYRVRFTHDLSGLLEVEATPDATGKTERLVVTSLAGEMSEAEIAAALAAMAGLKRHPRDAAANRHLRARIEAAYAMTRDVARNWVATLLVRFDAALESRDPRRIAAVREEIHQALDRFEADHVR